MNQILKPHTQTFDLIDIVTSSKPKKLFLFRFQLVCSLSVALSLLISYSYTLYTNSKKENISNVLLDNYNISMLYANNEGVYATSLSPNEYAYADNNYFVIGVIQIEKIDITYPILSEINDELLKISTCRFYGPNPNEIGNLCIAAHNYKDYRFFSNLSKLENDDIIKIYDLSGKELDYIVYYKYEVDANNFDCTSQETNGKREITLITCNSIKGKRVIVKAREASPLF